ncbi:hypothetical protein GOP47_0016948 [Adiantum capillus-veneris]|uniref:Uncharacterized protein n=1 Tax=Adiantum capillus-veneris TaxID=13818 RepID=A0A9D4ZAT2_ADICA|nr:hypothetical protein GOP47_0016948 [Adiantum capillus-veneris]
MRQLEIGKKGENGRGYRLSRQSLRSSLQLSYSGLLDRSDAKLVESTSTSSAAPARPPRSSRQAAGAAPNQYSDDYDQPISTRDHNICSGSIRLNEDDIGGVVSSADDLLVIELDVDVDNGDNGSGGATALLGESKDIEINRNADYPADEYSDATAISANHGLICPIKEAKNEDAVTSSDAAIAEYLSAQLELPAIGKLILSSDAEEEEEEEAATASAKAEKAAGAGGSVDVDIDSPIFTRQAHESRPLASAHFTRKSKATPPNERPLSPLRTILKRGDTLEATWKAICESKRQSSPFNRHHPKHEGIHIHNGLSRVKPQGPSPSLLSPIKQRHKPTVDMLHDDELTQPRLMRKREPSIPQEELNAKVESFLARRKAQIKIQREKSLLDYMEMVGRGAS